MTDKDKIIKALKIALDYGQIDGDHHKAWTIDQIVRMLTGDKYEEVIKTYKDGVDGPETYSWDTGIAP